MGIKINFPKNLIVVVIAVIIIIVVGFYARENLCLKKTEIAKLCIAGICCAFLIMVTCKTVLKYF